MNKPYSIRIFLPGGDPDGIRTIEKSNWSGSGIVIPRSLFADGRSRKELDKTGVYVLIGPPEGDGLPTVYIGEGDPIKSRLDSHLRSKEFWTTCLAFTSKDDNLNKAHVQHLESRLYALANGAKRCRLDNGNAPQLPSLSESDAADAEGFLAEMLLCFPVVGVHVFTSGELPPKSSLEYQIVSKGVAARGVETPQGFVVREGSTAALDTVPSCHDYLITTREALKENGVLIPKQGQLMFTQDYVFASPSTAAGVVLGRSANGRQEWQTSKGQTLKAIQGGEAPLK